MLPINPDDIDTALVRRIRAMLYLGRRHQRSPGYFRDAGEALVLLQTDKARPLWRRLVRELTGISPRRAYDLMSLAKGKDLADVRAENAARVRKHRRDRWLSPKGRRRKRAKRPV